MRTFRIVSKDRNSKIMHDTSDVIICNFFVLNHSFREIEKACFEN